MANDKKFIVKNGLLTQESVVIGSSTDNGVDKLQVTGSTNLIQTTAGTPTIRVTNLGGAGSSIIAEFAGESDSLQIINTGAGDYSLLNTQQNNGIRFYDDTAGLAILYNNTVDLAFSSSGIDFKRNPTVNSNTIWHAGNDGSGSGLDADVLDGLDSTQFLRSDESDTMTGDLTIIGNLTVQGTTTTVNTETILLADNIITLNSNYTGSTPTENAGFEVERGTLTNSSLVWDETNDYFKLISAGSDLGRIITTADEGAGNGFDADTVDGLQAAQFLRSDADDTATGNIIFQGTITVGNNTASGATIIMDGQAGNRYIYSNNGEIGFQNSAFAYAAYSDGSNNWRVLNDTYAKRFIDADNNTYLLDPAGTSVLNDISLEGQIIHNGDTNTYLDFNAEDSFQVVTGGSARLTVTNTAVTATQNFVGPRFVDSSNAAYYADPAATSVFNTLGLDSDLFHNGDTDNKISFTTDTQTFTTGNIARLAINNTSVTGYVDFIAPRFVDSNSTSYYADFANTAVSIAAAGTINAANANFYNGGTTNDLNIGKNANERFNFNVTDGVGYIRYYQDETDTTDHSVNFEIVSASTGNNRFNFNADINAGTNNITGGLGVFSSGVYATTYYDLDNELYYADFASTGVSINAAGTVLAGNGSLAAPSFSFGSDTNTGMYRYASDTIGFSAGGNDEFRIYNTYTLSPGSSRAPIFYDSNNTAYYANPASSSVFNTLGIDSDLFHNGDTDTKLTFGTDTITLTTANVARLTINTTAITAALNTYAPRFYTDDYLVHTGDENTYVGFNAADTFGVWTGGANRLSIDNDSADFSVNVYAPRYYDSNNNAYYVDPAADSVMNTIILDDYIIHNGDTNSYFGFDAADNFGIWLNGAQAVDILSSGNMGLSTAADASYKLNVNGNYKQTTSTNAVVEIAGNELSMDRPDGGPFYIYNYGGPLITINATVEVDNVNQRVLVGWANAGQAADAVLTIMKATAQGNNPFNADNVMLSIGDIGTTDYTIRTDSFGNIFHVNDNGGNEIWYDSGASGRFALLNSGDVIIGNDSVTYTASDATTTFISGPNNNKLHMSGSLQLEGVNDIISLYAADAGNTAINEATFLAVNELGFSAGGGFYMDETTTVKVRGNKALSTSGNITAGNMYAARFYDSNDANYYGDFASTSRMNDISLVGQIIHDGDTNTYLDFNAADSFQVVTGGSARLTVNNTSVTAAQSFDAPLFRDSGNTSYTINGNTSSAWRISTPSGYVDVGPQNTSYSHFQTDRPKFYFNKTAAFDGGGIEAYDAAANASFPIYYDWNDTFYYGDFGGFSRMNGITFGNPGNGGNTKGRWLSIEGNTDASGEGSARIFFAEHNSTTASMDAYGMSLVYIGGSSTINSASGQPVTVSGIANGEWGILGHNNSVNGAWAMRGPRDATYVQASGSFRAPIFYDSNNTAYYGDFAGTSITNVMRANQFQVDGSTYIIDSPSGNYGSIRVDGAAGGSWAGYAIRDDWVFMADGATNAGIYNDTDNEWAIQFTRNAGTDLLFNGVKQAETENGYFLATNQMRAPIYYAPSSTSYWLDLDVGNTSDALRIPGRINRQNFATGNGASNLFLTAQDRNHFIWNTATNWGIFWATDTSASYRYTPFGDNMITFVGAGNVRSAIDLDNGNAYFQGEVTASNFRINGGNEDLGILKTYGSGLGDTMLFDGTEYWEKRVILPMQGVENSATTVTGEYVKNNNGPFASSYALRTSAYRDFDSDYIPVEPGEQIYGEIAVRYISGSGGLLYMGVRRYDKDKNPIASNDGIEYFVASAVNVTSTGWTTYRGHTTIPTSHTPFNGSDGGGCKYVRVIVLMNYSAGGALREFGPPVLKRANQLSNIATQNIDAEGDVYANRYYDRQNTAFYVDPASISIMNDVRANIYYDRANTARYMDPGAGGNVQGTWNWNNGSITNLNNLSFADPGPNEGIHWAGGNNWRIYESPDDLTTNSAGNLQILYNNNQVGLRVNTSGDGTFGRYAYAQRFYDSNNGTYYGDFASTSVFNQAQFTNSTPLRFTTTSTALFDHESNSTVVAFRMNKGGTSLSDGSNHGVLQLSRTNHNNAATSAGAGLYFSLKDSAGTLREYAGIYGRKTVAGTGGGELVFMNYGRNEVAYINSDYLSHVSDIRAPIFYDSDNTGFYVDPAGTSVTNVMRANQFQVDGSTYIIDSPSGNYGSIRVDGALGGWAGYAIRDDWVFMSSGAGNAGIYNDTNNQWAILAAQQSDVQIYFNGTWEERSRSGYMEARGSYRAPIFYDSNNTAYRIDGNGTSRLLTLQVDNVIQGSVNGYASYLLRDDNRTIAPSEDPAGQMQFGFTSWNNNNGSPYADYLHLRSYTDASGGSDNLVMFRKDAIGMRIWQQSWGSATAYSTYRNVALYNENPGSSNDLYASIFYDSNDTQYRIDPTNISRIKHLEVGAITQTSNYYDAAIEVREYNYGGAQADTYANAPRIGFHWSGRVASQIALASNGEIRVINNPGTATENFRANIVYGDGSIRSPIFYDSNNTAFYTNPASTSVVNNINVQGKAIFTGRTTDSAGSAGYITGTFVDDYLNNVAAEFHSGNDQPVTIYFKSGVNSPSDFGYITFDPDFDNSGENAAMVIGVENDGTGSSDFIKLNGRVDVDSNMFSTDNAEIMRWKQSGVTYGIINNDYLTHISDIRTPIFYDSDNTGYYIDPNSTSNIYRMQTANYVVIGGNFSNNAYDSTTGAKLMFGGGNSDAIGNYYIGTNLENYGGNYNKLDIRWHTGIRIGAQPGYGGVRIYDTEDLGTIRFSVNKGDAHTRVESGNFYASNLIDINNTAYYADPASTSRFNVTRSNDFYADNWFRNYNANEGLYNEQTGVHIYSSSAQEVRITGNNTGNAMNLRGLASYNSTSRFWIHGATDGYQGFLNSAGQWVLRITHNDGLSPGIRFQEEANETWTGNPGSDVGKIEYHANRFYIASGANSDRIVQFRRDGTDRSWIANDGVFVGTATSARWADLAERYEADAIYEAGTVLGVGGDKEVTLYQPGMPLAGAVSTKPAYRMNDDNYGNDDSIHSKMNPFVALKGRIPVKINGSAKKGQWIIADKDGKGRAVDYGTPGINTFDIIGIALENGENEVEVKV